MDLKSSKWRRPSKNHFFTIIAVFLIQHQLHVSVKCAEATKKVHIVYMGEKEHEDPAITKKIHYEMLLTLLGSKEAARSSILYSYRHGFSGFAAKLTESQAEDIAEFPGVVQVIPNGIHKLHTTRSWEFIGLNHHSPQNLLKQSNMGQGTIIGVIDSGVWPESKSFHDEGMGPVPSHWKGICQQGESFNLSNCNRKIIGARWFVKGFQDQIPFNTTESGEFMSPRDGEGHGSHTASTAAGNFVEKVSYKGLAAGLARGGAPLAHLAIYKVCWNIEDGGCTDADLLKAFDKAIHDGVDILSVSIGNNIPLFSYVDMRNSIAIGSFHATLNGIPVICSAGNDGPISQTVENTAPWLITVAASTIDRTFPTAITLGNNKTLWGQSITTGQHNHGFASLTYSERIPLNPMVDSAKDCQPGSLNATLATGKIILCLSESNTQDMFSASTSVFEAGGVGLIFVQFHLDGIELCKIPCVKVDYEVGTQIVSYIRKARSPTAKLSFPKTVVGRRVSPRLASFSSRGPSSISPEVLKPDIAAPGVDILAAHRPANKDQVDSYEFLSGTSMSCPHVTGIVALIKSLHQNWSPAAIRSALVTTASQTGTDGMKIFEEGSTTKEADAFDIGGGHVNPEKAVYPGLVYDTNTKEYIQFLCSMGYSSSSVTRLTNATINCMKKANTRLNLNLPSITIPNLKTRAKVARKVTNVGNVNSEYKAIVQAPFGINMRVEPPTLSFNMSNKILSYEVTFFSTQKVQGGYRFGSLTWTDGEHFVRSPISVRAMEAYADV
ncbi:PREDICTED: subtilisin-like protease SBT3.5 [Populus euphratica]|uniref:Subtilisin-like protease SBT3.5 n=1 Tax=Populus euphratica TaxID=75702 RepID=A0AAJ6V2G9_POPEU|nr:PREDICTED: subtilisin-like protease SBT3.5 [Populus euphratica]